MENKHTPGPWLYVHGYIVEKMGNGEIYAIAKLLTAWDDDEAKANARLIAAAPETAKERDELKKENEELKSRIKELEDEVETLRQFDER